MKSHRVACAEAGKQQVVLPTTHDVVSADRRGGLSGGEGRELGLSNSLGRAEVDSGADVGERVVDAVVVDVADALDATSFESCHRIRAQVLVDGAFQPRVDPHGPGGGLDLRPQLDEAVGNFEPKLEVVAVGIPSAKSVVHPNII